MTDLRGSSIVSFPRLELLEGLLECPCCLDVSVPPITCCGSGHTICFFCRPKLSRCALCREKYTNTRNLPLEKIFRECIIVCKYSELGCDVKCKGEDYMEHLKRCSFRCLICIRCSKMVKIKDYVEHLKSVHGAFEWDAEPSGNTYCHSLAMSNDFLEEERFPDKYAVFDGQHFIVSSMIKSYFLYIWANIIPKDEEECNEGDISCYSVEFQLENNSKARPTVEWFVPIRSIHNGDPDETECLCIPGHPTLRNFLQDNYDNLVERSVGEESRYILNFSFRLTKTCDVL